MNSAHRANIATTYVWRAKTPPESSVQMCSLSDPLMDINTGGGNMVQQRRGRALLRIAAHPDRHALQEAQHVGAAQTPGHEVLQ
jgi:hypothetical protein